MTTTIAKMLGRQQGRLMAMARIQQYILPLLTWMLVATAWFSFRSSLLIAILASAAIAVTLAALTTGSARVF